MSGPSRRAVLAGAMGAGLLGLRASAGEPPLRIVLLVASGGWDPLFALDPKPAGPGVDGPHPDTNPGDPLDVEEIRSFGDLRIATNERRRPAISQFFDAWSDRTAVVNGLWVGSLSHWQASIRVLTGTTSDRAPDLAALAGATLGADRPLAAIDLSGVARFGPYAPSCARTGVRGQLRALLEPGVRFPTPDDGGTWVRGAWAPGPEDRDAMAAFQAARRDGSLVRDTSVAGRLAARLDRLEGERRAAELLEVGPALLDSLPAGDRPLLREQVPLAVDLLASDVCHAVVLGSGQLWDTHADASRQHQSHDALFNGLRLLADGLETEGLFDRTLVVVLSEFGRTPARNEHGGTDHWPYTSALLMGAGVAGGARVGATDDGGVGLPADPTTGAVDDAAGLLRYDHLVAGVLDAAGVDASRHLPGVTPMRAFRA